MRKCVDQFWKRMTPTAAWVGLISGTLAAVVVAVLSKDALGGASVGVLGLSGQGASFVAAGAAFAADIAASVPISLATSPRNEAELHGLVYSLTPRSELRDPHESSLAWYQRPTRLAAVSLAMAIVLNIVFR